MRSHPIRKLTSVGPFVRIDASTLNILNGAAVRVANGSFLNATGDLFSIVNAGKLNLPIGAPVTVTGSPVLNVSAPS